MATRRMFSLNIVDSDAFLDMPTSSQLLYYHLGMRADDEGFVGNPKRVVRMLGSNDDDMTLLKAKKFVIQFDSGICVIKHWLIHNQIRMDRFKPTTYGKEKAQLILKENNSYKLALNNDKIDWQPNDNHGLPQVKLSESNLSKDKLKGAIEKPWKKYTKGPTSIGDLINKDRQ